MLKFKKPTTNQKKQKAIIAKSDFFEKLIIKLNAPSLKEKTNFFRLLAVAQKAWLWIRDSLISIQKSEQNKWFIIILNDLIRQLTQGQALGTALQNHDYFFNLDEIALIKSAETMGNMPEMLTEIANELENLQTIKQKIKKALTYPLILIGLSIAAVIVLLIFVMPTIVSLFPNTESLPAITKFMLRASEFLKYARPFLGIWIVWLIILYKFLYQFMLPFKIFIDKLFISIPVVSGVTKSFYMYRFSKLLGQFYSSGVSPIVALQLMADIFSNFLYKKKAIEIKRDLEAWFNFYESMEWSSLFDPILVQIIHVWEDTGDTAEILMKISDFYRNVLTNKIDIMMSVIEPLLMVFIASIIGTIVGSIFLPMADLVNVIK